ncbi:MAG: TonB-dependent receptor [Gemmatimonadota bacterium]|nr:TonB-dependent receptor [Gemmatimonadota bacterium]
MFTGRDRTRIRLAITLLAVIIGLVPLSPVLAQGVASAAVHGTIVTAAGDPAAGALVTLINTSTGTFRRVAVGSRGVFLFENVPVGGPFRLEGRFIGFEPASIDGITLHLGDRLSRQLVLGVPHPHRLDDVEVRGSSLRDAGAGGPAYSIPGEAVRNLPLLNRNFVGLFAMAPQATGASALSISGQHSKFNAIQVDGGSNSDFFGVNLTPGAGAGGRVISLEALDEIRVLVAPLDVRQGGFSGGLINAVTRSGTNELRGSAFVSHTRSELVGPDTAGVRVPTFNVLQYGMSIGGPILRNRLHFFAVADIQARQTQFVGPSTSDPTTGISDSTARRAAEIFRQRYAFDAGGPESPSLSQPNANLFLKLSWQSSRGHWVELTHSRLDARSDNLGRTVLNRPDRDGWQLSGSGFTTRAKTVTTRLKATSALGGGSFTNEMIASVGTIADNLESFTRTPLFLVQGDLPSRYLAAGSVKGAQDTETDQRVIELTDNLSWSGGNHLITVGTQNQLLHFHDTFFLGSWGVWTFGSVDALERREPLRYEVALPLKPGGPLADYSVAQLGGYLQDRWSATPRLTLTAGLRGDVPRFDAPSRNPVLASDSALGRIDTGLFPSGNAVISPRLGFAWDLGRDHASMLRGGIGAFAGRPAYAWLTNAYSNTGQEQTRLVCAVRNGVPAPTTDISRLPQRCTGAAPGSPLPSVTYFAPDFRFQQAIKYVLGADHDFNHGVTASTDLIHTRTRDHLYVSDVNLVERGANAEGRAMYGSITRSGTSAISWPTRVDSINFQNVFRFENNTADRSTALAAVLQKRWTGGGLLSVGYNWSRTDDVMSLTGNTGLLIMQTNPIDGSIAKRRLHRSARDIPHNLVAIAIVPASFGITASVFFRARSGTPYAYTVDGDANADGTVNNDLAYIPRDALDVSLTNPGAYSALDAFIESEPCLRGQRGHLMTRNSCRNPSVQNLDVRVAKTLSIGRHQSVEVGADAFNLPNLLNRDWGLVRETIGREDKGGLLSVAGWDQVANRPLYTVPAVLPSRNGVVVDASRWRMQLGARYSF